MVNISQKITYVMGNLKTQVADDGPEQLMLAIFKQALKDLRGKDLIRETRTIKHPKRKQWRTVTNLNKESAKEYLQGRMKNLELLGLDMKWVHETLVKSGLWDEVITAEMAKVPLEEREWMDYD